MSTDTDVRVFNLPDVGEGLVEALVVEILVEVGQEVKRFDVIMEVETDKAVVQLNAPWSGKVAEICVEADAYVAVGEPLLKIAVAAE